MCGKDWRVGGPAQDGPSLQDSGLGGRARGHHQGKGTLKARGSEASGQPLDMVWPLVPGKGGLPRLPRAQEPERTEW